MPNDLSSLRAELIKQTSAKVKEAYSSKEIHVIKAGNLVEELDGQFNVLSEHCIEWFGFHFPELSFLVSDNEVYLKCVLLGARKNFSEQKLKEFYTNSEGIKKILEKAKNSIGAEFTEEEISLVQELARSVLGLKENRNSLNSFIESSMKELAPNFSELCGALLGARFLAKAGSLQRLASFPSSTLQVLGAEKALFAHLKSGSKPPKYGYLYNHPLVKQAKPWVKGKVARILAAKLSIALRKDFFGDKQPIAKELQQDLEKKVQELSKLPPRQKSKGEYRQRNERPRNERKR